MIIHARVAKFGKEYQTYFNLRDKNRDYLMRARTIEEKNKWVQQLRRSAIKDENFVIT